jgi:subtilisin family serine protease
MEYLGIYEVSTPTCVPFKEERMKHTLFTLRLRILSSYFLCMVGLASMGCSGHSPKTFSGPGDSSEKTSQEPNPVAYEPQTVIVQAQKEALMRYLDGQGIQFSLEELEASESLFVLRYQHPQKAEEFSKQIQAQPFVTFAAPNYQVTRHQLSTTSIPSAPYWLMQWGLQNVGQDSPRGLQGKVGADIKVLEAWETTRGSHEVLVGVVDTGIDIEHPDLRGNIWINGAEQEANGGRPCVDDDGNGYPDDVYGWNFISENQAERYCGTAVGTPYARDDHGHGTHVAGIIGALGNNHIGIAGINWNVKLVALKFLDAQGRGYLDDAIRAIFYAIKIRVHILNNSWGGGPYHPGMDLAIRRAEAAGILFVAAAGNEGFNNDFEPHYPSSYTHSSVLAVAATDNRDKLAKFSSYGVNSVHIGAPGVDILSTVPVVAGKPASQSYEAWSGTSMATPMVTGAAALLMAHKPDLRKNPADVKKILMRTVDRANEMEGKVASGGRLNIGRAFRWLDNRLKDNEPNYFDPDTFEVDEEEIQIEVKLGNNQKTDISRSFKNPQAKYVRLHFDYIDVDAPYFDLFAFYNMFNHPIYSVETMMVQDYWTPWIKGHTLSFRFANSKVKLLEYGPKDFPSRWDGIEAGGVNCRPSKTIHEWVTCDVIVGETVFYNHKGNGFKISKAQYLIEKE